jgi:hypothetical protein
MAYLSMPKFLTGCHYNEEESSWHLEKKYKILAGSNEWQQVCNRSNPEKTGRSWEGADFSWLSSKASQTLILVRVTHCLNENGLFSLPSLGFRIMWLACKGTSKSMIE